MEIVWKNAKISLYLPKNNMNSVILLAIFGIILLCMMLLVKEDNYLAEETARVDVSFSIQMVLSNALNACKGDEEPTKVIESQHLTCQHTRAGTMIRLLLKHW